jgi:hypothetical protein
VKLTNRFTLISGEFNGRVSILIVGTLMISAVLDQIFTSVLAVVMGSALSEEFDNDA